MPSHDDREHYPEKARVNLSHGSGGRASAQLIEALFLANFDNPWLRQENDQAQLAMPARRLAVSTDSYVISPLFFPGGDIGSLAVHGTVNDIAMSGARPLYLTAGFILEEGFPLDRLENIVKSMADAAKKTKVAIVTGDTKVVERGKGDGIFINTTGIGVIEHRGMISAELAKPGDRVILSGSIGDHGVAIMSSRENLSFATTIHSDSAALHDLVAAMVEAVPGIHCLRDPTRGGLATTLNELARKSSVGMNIDESAIPVKTAVRAACEILGLDPLYVANEGKLVCICAAEDANQLLKVMRQHPLARDAAIIGEVIEDDEGMVQMATAIGGKRVVDWLAGEQLPRIC